MGSWATRMSVKPPVSHAGTGCLSGARSALPGPWLSQGMFRAASNGSQHLQELGRLRPLTLSCPQRSWDLELPQSKSPRFSQGQPPN